MKNMILIKYYILLALAVLCQAVAAQLPVNLKAHISYLASDSLYGRMTGTPEEMKAALYIVRELTKAGVTNPKGNFKVSHYLQQFKYSPKVDTSVSSITGHNVVGFINNKAANTIVLGAHYDHLGWGLPAHSTHRGEPAIHNGADDNASGVAVIIELARLLKSSSFKNNNYLIVAFSGEELGLYGSKWFVEHSRMKPPKINYMLNFDMVGRVDSNKLVINGVGTSPIWTETMKNIPGPLRVKTTESGVGPSDHTSFYLKSIPVLHFFSGQHKDYHKPSDDEEKINYEGIEYIIGYVMKLVEEIDSKGKISFTKTKDDSQENTPRFTVTLGVMPDYTYEGEGMRIDGVTENKPAFNAGLRQGDVVVQLGDVKVMDMMSYMKSLSNFKKGDRTTVKVKRGNEIIEKDIQF